MTMNWMAVGVVTGVAVTIVTLSATIPALRRALRLEREQEERFFDKTGL